MSAAIDGLVDFDGSGIAIIGSRHWRDFKAVHEFVRNLPQHVAIVSGGARGVDTVAETAARVRGRIVVSFRPFEVKPGVFVIFRHYMHGQGPAQIDRLEYGPFKTFRAAAFFRNGLIVQNADHVVAFRAAGKSNGTDNAIEQALALCKPVTIKNEDGSSTSANAPTTVSTEIETL